MRRSALATACVLLPLLPLSAAFAGPGELTVLSVTSLKGPVGEAVARYQQETGTAVAVFYATPEKLKAGLHDRHPDIVVASQDSMAALEKAGGVRADSRSTLGRVGVGVAVGRNAGATPDLSSPDAFKRALQGAKSLVLPDPSESAEGVQAKAVLDKAGLADALKAKTQYGSGGNPIAPVGFGNVELGLQSIHQILATPDVKLAAPVPGELQQWTRFELALVDEPPNPSEAGELVKYLGSAPTKARLAERGIEAAP